MPTYSRTVYIEVTGEDEVDAMNAIYAALENATEDPNITNVDYEGPMEEVTDDVADASSIEADPMAAQRKGL